MIVKQKKFTNKLKRRPK